MSREDPQIKLRLPSELKAQIAASAEEHGRSMNADIVARLQESFADDTAVDRDEVAALVKQVTELMKRIDTEH